MARFIGLDLGGNKVNVTAYEEGQFLINAMIESPANVKEGPDACLEAMFRSFTAGCEEVGWTQSEVDAVGLGTPGPASADGVLNALGSVNFPGEAFRSFPVRARLSERLGKSVTYLNDGNAAAYYAHWQKFGWGSGKTSVSLIVGTGLGGGVVTGDTVLTGKVGFAAELGHVKLPADWNPHEFYETRCNCGNRNDLEAVASLTGIEKNLLPHYLPRYPGHPLREMKLAEAAKAVRSYGEEQDPMALEIFQAQAWALAAHIDQMVNILDMDAVMIGGGVVEAQPAFRTWFITRVREALNLRIEQRDLDIDIVPDRDMAGARGAALYAEHLHRLGLLDRR